MILTCPNCASRYVVDDAHVGPGGRMVRCTNCGNAWRAEPAARPLEPLRPNDVKDLTQAARTADLPGEALPKHFRQQAQARAEARQAVTAGVIWGAMAAILGVLVVLSVVFRTEVARVWPRTASVYAALGLKVNVVGLNLEQQTTVPFEQEGRPAIRVSGVVRNLTAAPVAAPPLKVDLVDEAGVVLVSRTVVLDGGPVAAGAARSYSVAFLDPPESTGGSESTFVVGRDGPPAAAAASPPPLRGAAGPLAADE